MLCTCTIKIPDSHSPIDIDLRDMNIQCRRFCGTVTRYSVYYSMVRVLLDIPKYAIYIYSIFSVLLILFSVQRTEYSDYVL